MRKRRTRSEILSIRRIDEIPTGTPRRYADGRGYIRLRWKVGVERYVEAYEHRVVAGLPDAHVHHKDENKANNCPGNLQPLTPEEHVRVHKVGRPSPLRGRRIGSAKKWVLWEGLPGVEAYGRRQRRLAREERRRQFRSRMADLYAAGLTTTQIGQRVGLDESNVSIALRAHGVQMRERGAYRPTVDRDLVREWHADGVRAGEMLQRLNGTVGRPRLYRLFDELGLPRFPSGRPPMRAGGA
jgi:predicted transcriptional regulator with HTH domain